MICDEKAAAKISNIVPASKDNLSQTKQQQTLFLPHRKKQARTNAAEARQRKERKTKQKGYTAMSDQFTTPARKGRRVSFVHRRALGSPRSPMSPGGNFRGNNDRLEKMARRRSMAHLRAEQHMATSPFKTPRKQAPRYAAVCLAFPTMWVSLSCACCSFFTSNPNFADIGCHWVCVCVPACACVCLRACVCACVCACVAVCLCACVFLCAGVAVCLCACVFLCLSVCLSASLPLCLSVFLVAFSTQPEGGANGMSATELTDLYSNCIKMCSENVGPVEARVDTHKEK